MGRADYRKREQILKKRNQNLVNSSDIQQEVGVAKTDLGTITMGNVKSIWSEREECPKTATGETSSSPGPTSDVKSLMPEETVNGVKIVSEKVLNTENANGESLIKRKRKIRKKKKLATSVTLDPHDNIEDAEGANCGQQDTPSSEEPPLQYQVNDGQHIDGNIVSSLSEKPTNRNAVTRSKRMLLILDVNGLLVDVIYPPPKDCKPDIKILRRAIFKRPFLDEFLGFCFEKFDVAIWSSRTRKILDPVLDYLLGDLKKKLVFVWDLSHCTNTRARSLENHYKFIVFKKLGKIWEENGCIASENGYYDESNTLLLDDSPYKALLNPKHTGIFPSPYRHVDINDNCLGPEGDLRIYLEGVAASENVKTYVEQHPFGQRAIDETSPDWVFLLKDNIQKIRILIDRRKPCRIGL